MKMPRKIKRVLIYRLGSLGDTVVALPALHLVARCFPEAERRMLTNFPVSVKAPAAKAILGSNGLVDGYFRYAAGTRSPLALLRLWWRLICWDPEVLIYLGAARGIESTRRDARFFRVCGIRRLIGVPLTQEMQRNLYDAKEDALEPECERLARNLSELGDARVHDPMSWDLRLTEAERRLAREVLSAVEGRPVLSVSVGTKVQSKDWGRENWRTLLEELGRIYPHYALTLLGSREESETSEFAGVGWKSGAGDQSLVVNLCGRLTPRESAACLERSRLFLGHDSGPMHLASAVQTPCVAIFAARNLPRVWYPHGRHHRVIRHKVECAGCGLEACMIERKRCLTGISVAEVVSEVCATLR